MADFTYLLRPGTIEEVVGQSHLLNLNASFYKLLKNQTLAHIFLFGPPGVGKTTLARLIAKLQDRPFYEFNATTFKIEALRKAVAQYEGALLAPLIFIDEVHRLSKNQQEVLLPMMEKNQLMFIGASTENPFYTVTAAMRSRALLFELKSLSFKELEILLQRAVNYAELTLDQEAKTYLIRSSGGDARAMLKLLEFASAISKEIDINLLQSIRPTALHDGSSEDSVHYDLISAMIKSIRGSDENAAIYYLARLIAGGENPEFIARRLVILASEDIGNANPQALILSSSCMQSVAKIGYPEARILLSQTVIYLCGSPKSNSAYEAINSALKAVESGEILDVPEQILTHSKNYLYPHNYGGWVEQKYLTKDLKFVEFKPIGYEQKMGAWLEALKKPKA